MMTPHSESKKIMSNAAVPIIPGYHGEKQDVDYLMAEAEKIQYPVLIKAVMGGGGKVLSHTTHMHHCTHAH